VDLVGTIIAAVVGGVVGGVAGFVVARMQRTWDLDARREQDRKDRIRAAVEVVLKFMDEAEWAEAFGGMLSVDVPFRRMSMADRWAVSSVLRLFPGITSWEVFLYPPNYIDNGKIREVYDRRGAVATGPQLGWAAVGRPDRRVGEARGPGPAQLHLIGQSLG